MSRFCPRSCRVSGASGTVALLLASVLGCSAMAADTKLMEVADEEWTRIFNGQDLAGWTPKIRGQELGENLADTFRVEDGLLTVSYDGYGDFDHQYGHLFYETPYAYYRLRFEYRFLGDQAPNAPEWAWRNGGVMLHSQAPESMTVEQGFPVSIEFQLLGGRSDGTVRSTGNLCTPGTHVHYNDQFDESHCINADSPTFDGDQWVRAEALVLGSEHVVHYINDQQVIEYTRITLGGGGAEPLSDEFKEDGKAWDQGYISLQSEGAPIQFRNIEVLDLSGCIEPGNPAFRPYFIKSKPGTCD